jgi:hypothetical protein
VSVFTVSAQEGFLYIAVTDDAGHPLALPPATLLGDYNGDGIVNAADYVEWRNGLGTAFNQTDYDVWRAHFGQTTGSGFGVRQNATTPEPATMMLLVFTTAGWCLRRSGTA